jgi:hypothetical protein
LALIGCASGPAVMDKSVPEEQRATLYLVGSDYSIKKVDGKSIPGAFGIFAADAKGTGGGTFKKKLKPTAQIPAGTRKIEVDVSANCGSLNPNPFSDACTPSITHDFEPGKKYKIKYEMVGTEFKLVLSEITGEIPEE